MGALCLLLPSDGNLLPHSRSFGHKFSQPLRSSPQDYFQIKASPVWLHALNLQMKKDRNPQSLRVRHHILLKMYENAKILSCISCIFVGMVVSIYQYALVVKSSEASTAIISLRHLSLPSLFTRSNSRISWWTFYTINISKSFSKTIYKIFVPGQHLLH